MKNKFKKSKIIVPALALITATTVASVTGTVAWFTATQATTVTAGNFTTVSADGSLEVTSTAGIATTKNGTDGITVSATGMLDASYNGTDVYTDIPNAGTGTSDEKYQIISNPYQLGNSSKYYAVTWSYTFSVTVDSGITSQYAIFFDGSTTEFTDSASGTTMAGLRISIKDAHTSNNRRVVVGAKTNSSNNTYVSSATATTTYVAPTTNGASSTSPYFFSSEYVKNGANILANATGYVSNPSDRADYIGTTAAPNNDHKAILTANVVAWFEGTDPSIANNSNGTLPNMSTVQATLGFYAREIKTTD